jgi:hypothetical protein
MEIAGPAPDLTLPGLPSTGGTRGTSGDRRQQAELRQVDSAATRDGTLPPAFDSIHGVTTPAPLPTDLAEAHALILRQREEWPSPKPAPRVPRR